MNDRPWYYSDGQSTIGPFVWQKLQAMVRAGIISDTTLVWSDELEDWTAYRELLKAPPAPPTCSPQLLVPSNHGGTFTKIAGGIFTAFIVLAVAKPIGHFFGQETAQQYQAGNRDAQIEAGVARAAADLNKSLPLRLDEMTTVTAVVAAGKMMIYRHRLDKEAADLDVAEFQSSLSKQLTHNVCNTKKMADMLPYGAVYQYLYFDSADLKVAEVRIAKGACG